MQSDKGKLTNNHNVYSFQLGYMYFHGGEILPFGSNNWVNLLGLTSPITLIIPTCF